MAAAGPCGSIPQLDRKAFPARPDVDNRFLPLVPGTQTVLKGFVGEGEERRAHRVVTTVTDLTKVIHGIQAIVVFDRDFEEGELVESELAFFAQEADGTVWGLGEYPEEFEDGRFVGAPNTWIAGLQGAKAGFAMLARPRVGTPTYVQGSVPEIDFLDCATVFRTGQRTCVPVKCFTNVLVTDEFSPLEPEGGHQRKFYAPGVGNIRVTAVGGDAPENLELARVRQLCPGAFAKVRAQALEQDRRGRRISRDVYARTPPAKDTLAAKTC